jgi:predicted RNase H-like nuclease (RuvC/YqgF family)
MMLCAKKSLTLTELPEQLTELPEQLTELPEQLTELPKQLTELPEQLTGRKTADAKQRNRETENYKSTEIQKLQKQLGR